jgi:hypothetical protein
MYLLARRLLLSHVSHDTTLEKPPVSGAATQRALDRIAVGPPYFGLLDLEERDDGTVVATVPPIPPGAPERGAVQARQVARHLAILGSCAAALGRDDDVRHHYLATGAHYMRLASSPDHLPDEPLRGEAVAHWVDRRSARAYVKLLGPDGQGLNVLDARYSVLSPKMFTRLHPPAGDLAAPPAPGEPMPEWEVEVDPVVIPDGYRRECGPIPVEACAGHFPHYPAAPVAVVMGHLCDLAGMVAIDREGGEGRYRIEEGHVLASKLAAAGDELVLEARYGRSTGEGHLIHGRALVSEDVVGQVDVTMTVGAQ